MFTSLVDQWWRSYEWWLSALGARPRPEPPSKPARPLGADPSLRGPLPAPVAPAEPAPPELAAHPAANDVAAFRGPPPGLEPEAEEFSSELDDEDPDEDLDEDESEIAVVPDEVLRTQLQQARAVAEVEALAGPHRILLSTPAGPGSLSEALKFLEEAGRVQSAFVEDEELGPHLLYTPVARAG